MGHQVAAALREGDRSSLRHRPEYDLDGSVAEVIAPCQGLCKLWSMVTDGEVVSTRLLGAEGG